MFCSQCGKMVEDGAGFCSVCGNAIETDVSVEVENTAVVTEVEAPKVEEPLIVQQSPHGSYCANCGTYVEGDQQFCSKCGAARGVVKKAKTDNEILLLIKKMIKTPTDGFLALYQAQDKKVSMIFVAIQAIVAVVYGVLLNNKLVAFYNDYIQNLTVNITNTISKFLSDLGKFVPGVGGSVTGEIAGGLFANLGIDTAVINMLKYDSDMIGIGIVLLTVLGAIIAQIVLLFLMMKLFKLDGAFMDAVKIYAAKSYWSAVGMIISLIILLFSPSVSMVLIVIVGCLVNHSIEQMLRFHSPGSKNQIFWIQLIMNVIEIGSVCLCVYIVFEEFLSNFTSYMKALIPYLGDVL